MKGYLFICALVGVVVAQGPRHTLVGFITAQGPRGTHVGNVVEEVARGMHPDYIVGQDCIDIQKDCLTMATSPFQKIQCWVQFGLCMAPRLKERTEECAPRMMQCKAEAGRDWWKNFACAAAYIKCFYA